MYYSNYKIKWAFLWKNNNEEVILLEKERIVDPFVNYIKRTQKEDKAPDKYSKKSPYLRTKSRHVWKGILPETLEHGYQKLDIQIEDPYFNNIKESVWVFKE